MDFLKRSLAPLADEAWEEIDEQARRILQGNLSARRLDDFSGPHGLSFSAVNLGRVKTNRSQPIKGVKWGMREVLPLAEIRVPFSLDIWDLDDVARGGKTPDLSALEEAARQAAMFEECAVYSGLDTACIQGILAATGLKPTTLPKEAEDLPEVIENAVVSIQQAGIGGPYALVLGTEPYKMMMAGDRRGYPLRKRIIDILGTEPQWTPALEGGAVFSKRGGDYELTVGQDLAIGYHSHDKAKVHLYITESLTFRVLEENAAVALEKSSK